MLEKEKKAQDQFDLLFSFKKEQEYKNSNQEHKNLEFERLTPAFNRLISHLGDCYTDLLKFQSWENELKEKNLEIQDLKTAFNRLIRNLGDYYGDLQGILG